MLISHQSRLSSCQPAWSGARTRATNYRKTSCGQLEIAILYHHNNKYIGLIQSWDSSLNLVNLTLQIVYPWRISISCNSHEEELRSFCVPKQLAIETYWAKLREVYSSYQEEHTPIMGHYHSLREKDDFYQKEIARNDFQIQLATENLLNLQHEWQKTTSTMANKLARMAARKEDLARKYLQMKTDSKVERSRASLQLNIMVNVSQDAIKHLEDMHDKLNKVRQLAEICSKYEHAGDELTDDAEYDLNSVDFEHLDKDMIDECKEYSKMDKFLLKVNRAKVQTICLRAEKAKLVKENLQLKNYIKRYLTDLALKGKDRPVSMRIRTEAPKTDNKALNRPVTCIEGVLSNAVQHEKRMRNFERRNKDSSIRAYPRVQCWMQSA
ncbi:hypothetical protein PYW08_004635 [Mythimna loreyi]|uniref:Uncharacterized protein n=1 Tax=Mythimna loreyi TaxID=667449 RepID=A0ACC2QPL2_9NEOP|nr:hypothetical protein PYW08_004635 [Mythimna loreyi]